MAKVNLNEGKVALKVPSRNPTLQFDELQMLFGKPYVIDLEDTEGSITVYTPTIGNIVELGETKFYNTLNIFITNTTTYRLPLWEVGVNWNELSDFELFVMLYTGIDHDASKLIFGDLDFSKFKPFMLNDEMVLYDEESHITINKEVYNHISQYLRNVFKIFPEEKITSDKILQKWYINADKRKKANEETKIAEGKEEHSSIRSIISACVNHPGFKYNLEELKTVNVCQFYDSVQRLQVYESTTALMKGMYSGFIDGKKIKSDEYNFMRDIKNN